MKIYATYNIKGGVGKTTAAVNLAYLSAADGLRTLLWDLDPQGAASFLFRIKPRVKGGGKALISGTKTLDEAIKGTDFDNLDLLPADFTYRNMDLILGSASKKPTQKLARLLAPLAAEYDVVILDCPPSISLVSENVLHATDVLVVPVIPTTLSVRTLDQLTDFVADFDGRRPEIVAFFSMADRRKRLHTEIIENLTSERPVVSPTVIPALSMIERMSVERAPVTAFAPRSVAARAYQALWSQLRPQLWCLPREAGPCVLIMPISHPPRRLVNHVLGRGISLQQVQVDNFTYGLINPVLGYAMSCLGAFLGLRCITRARAYAGAGRALWLLLASVAIGTTGIWTMHFIAMLGFTIPGQLILYNVPVTLASMLLAVLVVGIGLFIVGYTDDGPLPIVTGGLVIGIGVATMHYVGMAAMRMPDVVRYNIVLVIVSVFIAIVAGTAALWAGLRVRGVWSTLGASLVMGMAVCGMHYTGMAAMHVYADGSPMAMSGLSAEGFPVPLLLGVSIASFVVTLLVALAPSEEEIREDAMLTERLRVSK